MASLRLSLVRGCVSASWSTLTAGRSPHPTSPLPQAVLAACGALAQPPATPLQLGAVLRSRVASGTMVYYVLDAPMPFVGLHVSVMSSYGNANVFASVAGNGGPTVPVAPLTPGPGASDYASTTPLGVDVLNMYPTDPVVRTHCVRTQRANEFCRFIIGVSSTTPIAGVVISAYADGESRARTQRAGPGGVRLRLSVTPPSPPPPFSQARRVPCPLARPSWTRSCRACTSTTPTRCPARPPR